MSSVPVTDSGGAGAAAEGGLVALVERIWLAVLGTDADPRLPFLSCGGDSFHAVVVAMRLTEDVGVEVDYFTVLQAEGAGDLAQSIAAQIT